MSTTDRTAVQPTTTTTLRRADQLAAGAKIEHHGRTYEVAVVALYDGPLTALRHWRSVHVRGQRLPLLLVPPDHTFTVAL